MIAGDLFSDFCCVYKIQYTTVTMLTRHCVDIVIVDSPNAFASHVWPLEMSL